MARMNAFSQQIEVLLPKPFGHGFDYAPPVAGEVTPGHWVKVPFGRQQLYGVAWAAGTQDIAPDKLKPISAVVEDVPPLSAAFRHYIDWVASYTLAPRGMVLKMAMPVPDAFDPPSLPAHYLAGVSGEKMTSQRHNVLDVLADGTPRTVAELTEAAGVSDSVVRAMVKAGLLCETPPEAKAPPARPPVPNGPTLSDQQQAASDALAQKLGKGFSTTLIDGVTGSGKTEVYFEVVAGLLKQSQKRAQECGQQAEATGNNNVAQTLILLPEIALSVQWVARFTKRFGFKPAVWHSGLTAAQRRDTWRDIATGRAPVVVGARSALFLPYANLQLIVVDEEHEASYKQEEGVMYHARDMAVARGFHEKIPVVLASATPSLETVQNVQAGKYDVLHLPSRHGGASLPDVVLVDMRHETMDSGTWLSPQLRQALADTLNAKRQSLLFLNRRGYAPLLLCRACGHRFACPDCTSWLVVHGEDALKRRAASRETVRAAQSHREIVNAHQRYGVCDEKKRSEDRSSPEPCAMREPAGSQRAQSLKGTLVCHHCGYHTPVPQTCPACEVEDKLVPCGPGVERVVEEARLLFPDARIEAMTSDNADSLKEAQALVEAMQAGEVDILIGTQMVAKGHHFPALDLIGVVDADLGLSGGDLRAVERTYQLLHQVAGRAGREGAQGRVLMQTYMPEHPVMQALQAYDRDGLQSMELDSRQEAGLPPFGRLAAVLLDGVNEREVTQACRRLSGCFPHHPEVQVLGPAPAPMKRLRGRYRYRFLLKAPRGYPLQLDVARAVEAAKIDRRIRVRVDIDPYRFM